MTTGCIFYISYVRIQSISQSSGWFTGNNCFGLQKNTQDPGDGGLFIGVCVAMQLCVFLFKKFNPCPQSDKINGAGRHTRCIGLVSAFPPFPCAL